MNRLQLRNAVVGNTGRTDKLDVVNVGLDLALVEIGKRHVFRAMESDVNLAVAAGTSTLVVTISPGEVYNVLRVRLSSGTDDAWWVNVVSKNWLEQMYPKLAATTERGRPAWCYVNESNRVVFVPPTDAAYTAKVSFTKMPSLGAADTAVPTAVVALVGLDAAIVAWATAWTLRSIEKFQEAAQWDGQFNVTFAAAVVADGRSGVLVQHDVGRSYDAARPYNDPWAGR